MPKRCAPRPICSNRFSFLRAVVLQQGRCTKSPILLALLACLTMSDIVPCSAQSVGLVERWERQFQSGYAPLPVVGQNGDLYVIVDHRLFKIDPKAGSKKWSFYSGGGVSRSIAGVSTSVLSNGGVFVKTYDAAVYALDPTTGEVQWEFLGDGQGGVLSPLGYTANGLVYVSISYPGRILALDEVTGAIKWGVTNNAYFSPVVLSANGNLYFGARANTAVPSSAIHALNSKTGQPIWEFGFPTGASSIGQPAVNSQETVFATADNGLTYAIDGHTGQKKWEYRTEDPNKNQMDPVADSLGTVFVGLSQKIFAINAQSGSLKWKIQREDQIFYKPTLSEDGILYYTSGDGATGTSVLHALDSQTGNEKWSFPLPGFASGSLIIGKDGSFYLGVFSANSSKVLAWVGGQIPHATATASAQTFNGFIVGTRLTSPGAGYTNIPNVTVVGGGGSGAILTARVQDGSVVGVDVFDAGRGYTNVPTLLIDPPIRSPIPATAIASVADGSVSSIAVVERGYGYGNPVPVVQFVGGGGTGATGVAVVQNGAVVGILVTSGGSGYTSAPTVVISLPAGLPSVSIATSSVEVTLHMTPGFYYKLQSSQDGNVWSDVGNSFLAIDSTATQNFDVSSRAQYFRLVEGP